MKNHLIVCSRHDGGQDFVVVVNRSNSKLCIGPYECYAVLDDARWRPYLVEESEREHAIDVVVRANKNTIGTYYFQRLELRPGMRAAPATLAGRIAVVRHHGSDAVVVTTGNSFSVGSYELYGPGGKFSEKVDSEGFKAYRFLAFETKIPSALDGWGLEFVRWEYLDGSQATVDTGAAEDTSTSVGREMYAVTFKSPDQILDFVLLKHDETGRLTHCEWRLRAAYRSESGCYRWALFPTEAEAQIAALEYLGGLYGATRDWVAYIVTEDKLHPITGHKGSGESTPTMENEMGTIHASSKKNAVPTETSVTQESKTINVSLSVPDCNSRAVQGQVVYRDGEPQTISVTSGGYGCATEFQDVDHVRRAAQALSEFADVIEANSFQGSATASE